MSILMGEHGNSCGKSANLSECGRYRFMLRRWWDGRTGGSLRGGVCWIMLNPSTADGDKDDPTIRKCVGFSSQWGYRSLVVVNLFALRATNPNVVRDALRGCESAIEALEVTGGLTNARAIADAMFESELIVAAWGAPPWAASLGREVGKTPGVEVKCLGRTKSGAPRHPLFVAYKTPLEDWP